MTRTCKCTLEVALMLWVSSSAAHHAAYVYYDENNRIQVRGTLVDLKLQNPHSLFVVEGSVFVDGRRQDDAVHRWEIESPGSIFIRRWGIGDETFEVGDLVTFEGAPSRNPESKRIYARRFVLRDGTSFSDPRDNAFQFSTLDEVEEREGIQRLDGMWRPVGSSDAERPLNEVGLAAVEAFDPELSPLNTCETIGIPAALFAPAILAVHIDDQDATLHFEYYDVTRTFTLGSPPRAFGEDGALGVASARTEGDTLVIRSEEFPASKWGLGQIRGTDSGTDVPSSEMKSVEERYTPTDGGLGIVLEMTVRDPVYLSETWSERREFRRVADDTPLYPYECDVSGASFFSEEL